MRSGVTASAPTWRAGLQVDLEASDVSASTADVSSTVGSSVTGWATSYRTGLGQRPQLVVGLNGEQAAGLAWCLTRSSLNMSEATPERTTASGSSGFRGPVRTRWCAFFEDGNHVHAFC